MVEKAREKKQRILLHHSPEPIDPALAREIDEIVAVARRELVP